MHDENSISHPLSLSLSVSESCVYLLHDSEPLYQWIIIVYLWNGGTLNHESQYLVICLQCKFNCKNVSNIVAKECGRIMCLQLVSSLLLCFSNILYSSPIFFLLLVSLCICACLFFFPSATATGKKNTQMKWVFFSSLCTSHEFAFCILIHHFGTISFQAYNECNNNNNNNIIN